MQQGFNIGLQDFMPIAVSSGLFVSLATIYRPVMTQGPTGNYNGAMAAVLSNIPCMDAPYQTGPGAVSASERMGMPEVTAEAWRHVLLDSYYSIVSGIATGLGWQVEVDGTMYDLLGAESDSQRIMTRLRLQKATVSQP